MKTTLPMKSCSLLRIVLFVVCCQISVLAQTGPEGTDVVMRAMNDELQRSMKELQFKDLEKPYFIQYVIVDQQRYEASATFGSLTLTDWNRGRVVQVQVRVGDYDFDNSEFVSSNSRQNSSAGVLNPVVMDDDYDTLRHSLWLATDAAYKQAIEQIARKRAFVENRTRNEEFPDFSKEEPITQIAKKGSLAVDQKAWEERVRDWSRIFREFPDVHTSRVSLRGTLTHRYIVNSEGTRTLQPSQIVSIEISASTQAEDGMRMNYSIPLNVRSFDLLPSGDEITGLIRSVAADVSALRKAPVLSEDYSGPVLLAGQASAEMFARILAPNLSGQRLPLSERDPQGASDRSELTDRMNRLVLPEFLSVFDDPTEQSIGNHQLIGHYIVDDQGVPAKRVSLIQQGVLRELLMSRKPTKDLTQSNGHGRSAVPGRESAQIGNLFIQASEGKSYDELKQELINLCRREKLEYGVLIKALSPDGRGPIGSPVLVYKVFVSDGREELVRGVSATGITVKSLREIEAVGKDNFVANRVSGGAPTSVVAPAAVLLSELELKKPTGAQQKPALLTHPFFTK